VKKRLVLGAVALAAVGLIAAFAANAYANPTKTSTCSECHSGQTLVITASEMSNDGTTANYTVSAPGADVIAVFDGETKINQITGVSGTISVAVGKTYVLQAVVGPDNKSGWGTTSISPVAPVTATTTTTPDPTAVTTPTPDTTPVVTPDATGTASVRIHVMAAHGNGVSGMTVTLTNTLTGTTVTAETGRHGMVTFANLTKGTYTASVTLANGKILTKTFKVGDRNHRTVALKDHRDRNHGHTAEATVAHGHHSAKEVVTHGHDSANRD
jgi:hypothetical protein